MIKKMKKQIYAATKTVNNASSSSSKKTTKQVIDNRINTVDENNDGDDDCDDDNDYAGVNDDDYKKTLRKSYDGKDGGLWTKDHVDFVKLLVEKLSEVKKMPLKRIKELDEELEIDNIPIFKEDSILDKNSDESRSPTIKIPESIYETLKDCYKNSTCLKTIISKLLPFVVVPYIKKKNSI